MHQAQRTCVGGCIKSVVELNVPAWAVVAGGAPASRSWWGEGAHRIFQPLRTSFNRNPFLITVGLVPPGDTPEAVGGNNCGVGGCCCCGLGGSPSSLWSAARPALAHGILAVL